MTHQKKALHKQPVDELVAKGYAKVIEEDELEVLAQYHMEKFRNWMRPLGQMFLQILYITIKTAFM